MFFSSPEHHERALGRWSQLAARHFLAWLRPPRQRDYLEIGCGSGALTQVLQRDGAPARLSALDSSADALRLAQQRVPEALFYRGDALDLPFAPQSFDVLLAGLLFHYLSDPNWALRELCRVARPGACIAAYVWHLPDGFPAAPLLDVLRQGHFIPPAPDFPEILPELWQQHLREVQWQRLPLPEITATAAESASLLQALHLDSFGEVAAELGQALQKRLQEPLGAEILALRGRL